MKMPTSNGSIAVESIVARHSPTGTKSNVAPSGSTSPIEKWSAGSSTLPDLAKKTSSVCQSSPTVTRGGVPFMACVHG